MEIKFENVTYMDKLKNVNIVFKNNEITSIIGPNNSGKKNLLNLIYGIDLPTDGQIFIDNNKINKDTKNKKLKSIRNNISYLIDSDKEQLFNINILEDLMFGIKNFDEKYLYELLDIFDLKEEILIKNFMEISSGEKRKILLISTFLKNSKIIILDNPTKNLDYKGIQSLVKILKKLKRLGKVIIIISYDSNFVLEVSDNVLVMHGKRVLAFDFKYKILKNDNLMKKACLNMPNISLIENRVLELKNIKLGNRDNINDLIKDIYRYAK